ncbi:hypothetical protein F5050DRAFT_1905899 [Lentinula boryana]|uniref:Uncharacterized protein n=1 Tax=Lentinula boryana TaxID=40481 RepID=A0ABQ8Q0L9_9AGAR|nr:hypothetical protein F5050DRAFT_1905899 [Lentinula boryana]
MVNTSEGKGRGKGKSRAVQKGKGKANRKREGEEASDGEIETEAAVEASALEPEDSASRPPLQLPLRSPSQEKSQTLAREDILSTMVLPATPVSFHNSTLEAFRALQAFMANAHTYPSAELAIRHIFGDAYHASQWEPWLSCIISIEPDDEESFQSVSWELDAEISQLERDTSLEASLPEDNEVESLCADAMLRDPDQAYQVLGSFRDYLEDVVMRHCKQSFNFKEFDVWKLWHDIAKGELARCLKGNTGDGESDGEGSGGGVTKR